MVFLVLVYLQFRCINLSRMWSDINFLHIYGIMLTCGVLLCRGTCSRHLETTASFLGYIEELLQCNPDNGVVPLSEGALDRSRCKNIQYSKTFFHLRYDMASVCDWLQKFKNANAG
ncbi:hypothetical protein ATANTOWER_023028 [Ataeniobius toweri]|uniref:Uncharacterized protein n=1 Tax=Ataeniobius toweri TaxID=208326 RepID=A0ABU7C563_9TELE|nr:hypothetical protein [Ataeniobius toweri]